MLLFGFCLSLKLSLCLFVCLLFCGRKLQLSISLLFVCLSKISFNLNSLNKSRNFSSNVDIIDKQCNVILVADFWQLQRQVQLLFYTHLSSSNSTCFFRTTFLVSYFVLSTKNYSKQIKWAIKVEEEAVHLLAVTSQAEATGALLSCLVAKVELNFCLEKFENYSLKVN